MKLGIIGVGNMASAIIHGLLDNGILTNKEIMLANRSAEKLEHFANHHKLAVTTNNLDVLNFADTILLAVKPYQFETVIAPLHEQIVREQKTVISIAAGLSLNDLHDLFGSDVPIVRVMPNVNASVFASTTAICANEHVSRDVLADVTALFDALGKTYPIDESQMSTFIAIAGSAPAYAYLFMDALAQGALKNGMPKQQALDIAAQTLLGSAKMVLESGKHPRVLMDSVCSPGGTTIAAVASLEADGFLPTVINAVDACIKKDKNLGK